MAHNWYLHIQLQQCIDFYKKLATKEFQGNARLHTVMVRLTMAQVLNPYKVLPESTKASIILKNILGCTNS